MRLFYEHQPAYALARSRSSINMCVPFHPVWALNQVLLKCWVIIPHQSITQPLNIWLGIKQFYFSFLSKQVLSPIFFFFPSFSSSVIFWLYSVKPGDPLLSVSSTSLSSRHFGLQIQSTTLMSAIVRWSEFSLSGRRYQPLPSSGKWPGGVPSASSFHSVLRTNVTQPIIPA